MNKDVKTSYAALLAGAFLLTAAEGADAKSPEQLAEEKAQADAAAKAAKEEAKAKKKAEADAAKAAKAEAAAKAKEEREQAAAEAKAKKDAEKAAAAEAKAEAARLKAEEKAAKAQAAQKEKVVLESKNGITRPKADTKTGQVWAFADKLSAEKGSPVAISELAPVASAAGLNDATIRTQYARWKTFNSIFGSVPKAATPSAPASNDSTSEQAAA